MIASPTTPPHKSGEAQPLAKREDGRTEATSFFAQITSTDNSAAAANPGKRQINGMIVLAIVVISAAAGLVTMRRIGLGAKIELTDIKIDYPIEAAAALSMDHTRVLAELSSNTSLVNQVPVDQIQKNPFLWDAEMTATKTVDNTPKTKPTTVGNEAERIAAENRRKIEAKFNTLALNSVMDGRVPVATVSGTLVKVGDTIDGTFIVGAIRPKDRLVELLADGRTYTLTMKEPT